MNERQQALQEIERELAVRRTVYPRLVLQGKLTQAEADRRSHALRIAAYYLDSPADDTERAPDINTQ